MNEKIVNTLGDIAQYIHMLRNIGSFYEDDAVKYYRNLVDSLEESERFHLLPKDVLQACSRVLQDVRDGYMDFNDGFLRLANIIDSQTDEYKSAYKKLTDSLDMDGNLVELVDKTNDSKSYLNTINDLMQNYQNVYNRFGEMESVDALCAVGNAIKEGVEQNKLSKHSAEQLLEPLRDIKDNLFNENIQKDSVKKFYELLQDKLLKEDEKGPKGKDEKNDVENTEANDGLVGTIIKDGVTLGKNIGNVAVNIAKGIKEANKKINEKAETKAAEYDKNKEREMRAKDVVQSPTDDKRKLEEEQVKQDKLADKNDIKNQPVKDSQQSEPTQESLEKAIQKYIKSVESRSFNDSSESFVALANEINKAEKAGIIEKDFAEELRQPLREVQKGAYSLRLHQDAVKSLNDIISKEQQVIQKTTEQQRDMHANDIVQSQTDDKRKLEEEQIKQDKTADKQDVKKQEPREKSQNHQEFAKRIQDFMNSYKTKLEDGNVGEARYEIDKLARDIAKSGRDGVVPQALANQYRKMLVEQFQSSPQNIEHNKDKFITGLTDLWKKYEGKDTEKKQEQHREMRAKDVVQSQTDDKRKLEEDRIKQDKVLDKQDIKQQEPQTTETPKHRDGDYMGFGMRKGKDASLRPQDEKGLSTVEKSNRFKDAIVNVLNKREKEQREKEIQDRENKTLQEKLLMKKLFGKTNIGE